MPPRRSAGRSVRNGVARLGEDVAAGFGGERGEGELARDCRFVTDAFGVTTSPRTKADSFAVAFVLGFVSHIGSSSRGER